MRTQRLRSMFLPGVLALAAATLAAGTDVSQAKPASNGKPGVVILDGEEFPALSALSPPPIPRDNPQRVDENGWPLEDDPKVQLGKMLFFDARLSGDFDREPGPRADRRP